MSGRSLALCYHAVSPDWPDSLAVEPDVLEHQVKAFLGRGYEAVTFRELVTSDPHRKCMAVTFDDAYLSVYELGFPRLRALGVPATVFVPTAHIGGNREMGWPGIDHWLDTEWHDELRGASWDQLRELSNFGWEIGSHTRMHPRLSKISDERLIEELEGSRLDCERETDKPCLTIAYPYGDFDERVTEATGAAGYEGAAALAARAPVTSSRLDPMCVPRVAVYRGDSLRRIRLKALLLSRLPVAWNFALSARSSDR